MKSQESSNHQCGMVRVSSPERMSGEPAEASVHRSPLNCEACLAVLHDLNNAFAVVLMNAQVMEGKLPSYSRSKRYIHEIERSAQRGGALLKRLLAQFAGECDLGSRGSGSALETSVPPVSDCAALVTVQEPRVADGGGLSVPPASANRAAPVFAAGRATPHMKV